MILPLILLAVLSGSMPSQGGQSAVVPEQFRGWPGTFRKGPETVVIRWKSQLLLTLDRLSVPVDGQWHETVPTFSVRHRATWRENSILLEEQHNEGALWRHVYTLSGDGRHLVKWLKTEDGQQEIRRYLRIGQSAGQKPGR